MLQDGHEIRLPDKRTVEAVCPLSPCEEYEDIDAFDSLITRQSRNRNLEKQHEIGVGVYRAEQKEKICILKWMLQNLRIEEVMSSEEIYLMMVQGNRIGTGGIWKGEQYGKKTRKRAV